MATSCTPTWNLNQEFKDPCKSQYVHLDKSIKYHKNPLLTNFIYLLCISFAKWSQNWQQCRISCMCMRQWPSPCWEVCRKLHQSAQGEVIQNPYFSAKLLLESCHSEWRNAAKFKYKGRLLNNLPHIPLGSTYFHIIWLCLICVTDSDWLNTIMQFTNIQLCSSSWSCGGWT